MQGREINETKQHKTEEINQKLRELLGSFGLSPDTEYPLMQEILGYLIGCRIKLQGNIFGRFVDNVNIEEKEKYGVIKLGQSRAAFIALDKKYPGLFKMLKVELNPPEELKISRKETMTVFHKYFSSFNLDIFERDVLPDIEKYLKETPGMKERFQFCCKNPIDTSSTIDELQKVFDTKQISCDGSDCIEDTICRMASDAKWVPAKSVIAINNENPYSMDFYFLFKPDTESKEKTQAVVNYFNSLQTCSAVIDEEPHQIQKFFDLPAEYKNSQFMRVTVDSAVLASNSFLTKMKEQLDSYDLATLDKYRVKQKVDITQNDPVALISGKNTNKTHPPAPQHSGIITTTKVVMTVAGLATLGLFAIKAYKDIRDNFGNIFPGGPVMF